jgi:hypothetical protein
MKKKHTNDAQDTSNDVSWAFYSSFVPSLALAVQSVLFDVVHRDVRRHEVAST